MPTDEGIWGSSNDWYNPGSYQTGTKKENKLLCGYFGAAPTGYEQGSLGNGLYHDVLPHTAFAIRQKIDESISYCGLGNASVWSRVKYSLANKGTFGTFDKEDNRTVTNFAIPYKLSEKNGLWQTNMTSGGASAGQTTSGNRCRWSPQGFDNFDFTSTTSASNANANFNRTVTPYVSIPVRNFILFPVLRVASGMNENEDSTGYSGTQTVSLQKYIDLQNTVNYNTHPYIIGVSAQPYAFMNDVEDIDEVTGEGIGANANRDRTTVTNLMPNGLSVLSPLSYAMDAPVDVSNPTETLQEVYNYSCFKSSSTLTGIPLFGVYDNRSSLTPSMGQIAMSSNPTLQMLWFLPNEHAVYREKNNGTSGRYGYYYLEYYDNGPNDNFVDWVRQQIACFGLFFTEDEATVKRGKLNDPLMMLGVLDSNGIGQGYWVAGMDNVSQPQWQWDTTNKSSYKPSGGGGGDLDPEGTHRSWGFNPVSITDSTVRRYILNAAELQNFGDAVWNIIDTSDPDELIQNQTLTNFLTNNPLDCLVSLKRFALPNMSQARGVNIVLGKVATTATGHPFTSDATTLSCGQIGIHPIFSPDETWIDWRNYLCRYILYLPFCGCVSLDPHTILNKNLGIKYSIDYTTGSCVAWIMTYTLDGGFDAVIDSANGNCTVDIPFSGVQTATLTGQIYNANENLKSSKFNGIVDISKNAVSFVDNVRIGAVGAATNVGLEVGRGIVNLIHSSKQAQWNIDHTEIPFKLIGASTGLNGMTGDMYPCLLTYYPVTEDGFDEAEYLHTVGAACCETGTIAEYQGYVEASNVDLSSLDANLEIKNAIRNLLAGGVYYYGGNNQSNS